eukprot:TRINITY_DN14024_c0_g1_i1.p1 TRINITY_DN14024_c0_g1~~TRINITY_DN14024_c0_g1_i1.p1  ORF type:complete len:647 (-),score=226.93 TRINITY_DN14024_c0_g1_i1:62-2002(-)
MKKILIVFFLLSFVQLNLCFDSCQDSFCGCLNKNQKECKGIIYSIDQKEDALRSGYLSRMKEEKISTGKCFDSKKSKCFSREKEWILCPFSSSFCGASNGNKWTCCSPQHKCNSTISDVSPICIPSSSSPSMEKKMNERTISLEKKKEKMNVMDFIFIKYEKRQNVPVCNCPTFLNCCGLQCYAENAYRCFNKTGGGVMLCPTGTEICADGCYRRELYNCIDEKLVAIQNGTASGTLSGGAIAGIVIGGLVFLLLLIGLTIFLVLFYKSKEEKREGFDSMLLNDMRVGEVIGRGFFGEVYKGTWNGTTVALKTIKKEGTDDDGRKWREEIVLLHELNHPNIVRLLGIYLTSEKMFMVVEFMENGALDAFLRKKKNADRLSNNDLLLMGFDIAKGMMYLQSKGVIHRDLACRNLLVDSSLRVKISDFGMSRHGLIYQATSREIPYRWAAPEVFLRNESLPASDVWSFAVCLWEIFTLGSTPYEGISNKEVAKQVVEDGLRLERVPRCSPETYELMTMCWKLNPEERPDFQEIYERMMISNTDVLSSHEDRGYKKQLGTPTVVRANSKKKYGNGNAPTSTVITSPKIATSHWTRTETSTNSQFSENAKDRRRESTDQPSGLRVAELSTGDEDVHYENSGGEGSNPTSK